MTMRQPLILTMCVGVFALGACSEDPADEGLTDPTLPATGSTSGPDDTTTDLPAESSSSAEGSTGGTTSVDPDSSTGEPSSLSAWRLDAIAFRDPHFIHEDAGDVTANGINAPLNQQIMSDGGDGILDLGIVFLFDPLDQTDEAMNGFYVANGECTAPADEATCDIIMGQGAYLTMYLVDQTGPCFTPNPDEISDYDDPPEPPTPVAGPCFASLPTEVPFTLDTMPFDLPLTEFQVYASFQNNPATMLFGTMTGMLSTADANATMIYVPAVGAAVPMSDLLRDQDMEGTAGWRIHIAFSAVPTVWTGVE